MPSILLSSYGNQGFKVYTYALHYKRMILKPNQIFPIKFQSELTIGKQEVQTHYAEVSKERSRNSPFLNVILTNTPVILDTVYHYIRNAIQKLIAKINLMNTIVNT